MMFLILLMVSSSYSNVLILGNKIKMNTVLKTLIQDDSSILSQPLFHYFGISQTGLSSERASFVFADESMSCSDKYKDLIETVPRKQRFVISKLNPNDSLLNKLCFPDHFYRFILFEEDMEDEDDNATIAKESFIKDLKKNIIVIHSDRVTIDLYCNDGKVIENLVEINMKKMKRILNKDEENVFDVCTRPDPTQPFRVAYNIWKPFVFKR